MQELVTGNPKLRRVLYSIYAVVGLITGSVQVAYAAAELGQPVWLTVALAVYAYVGVSFGFAAATKVSAAPIAPVVDEVEADSEANLD